MEDLLVARNEIVSSYHYHFCYNNYIFILFFLFYKTILQEWQLLEISILRSLRSVDLSSDEPPGGGGRVVFL